jgi:hypothetical protein
MPIAKPPAAASTSGRRDVIISRASARVAARQHQQHDEIAAGEPRGLEAGEEQRGIEQSGGGAEQHAAALAAPARQHEVAQAGQQHGAIGLDMDQLDGVDIGETEHEGADRGGAGRQAEMALGEAVEAEKADRREGRQGQHIGREAVGADDPQRRRDRTQQKKRVGIAERAALRIEEDRIGPMGGTGQHMVPMLDQRDRDIAVLEVPDGAVEAGEQPAAKHQHEAGREQRGGEPAIETMRRFHHGVRALKRTASPPRPQSRIGGEQAARKHVPSTTTAPSRQRPMNATRTS